MAKENAAGIARGIEAQKPGVSPGQESAEAPPSTDSQGAAATKNRARTPKSGQFDPADPNQRAELMRQFSHLQDREGLTFDPRLHVWDAGKGQPATTPAGVLKRKPGRKSRARAGASSSYIPPETGPADGFQGSAAADDGIVTEADRNRTSARVAASMWFNTLTFVFGEDAQPARHYREREQLESALQEHFDTHGRWQVPTWLGIANVLGAHLGRVTSSERARERAKGLGERFAAAVAWFRQAATPKRKRQAEPAGEGEGERQAADS